MWLDAMTAGPEVGTCSPPFTVSRRPNALKATDAAATTGG